MGDTGATQRLLILACSQRKRPDPGLVSAIERYDGPFFRVLRRYQRSFSAADPEAKPPPDVYILSARYGLISANQPIADYEQRMTTERADELRPCVLTDLQDLLGTNPLYDELFFCMGRDYRQAFDGWEIRHPSKLSLAWAEGSIGSKQAQLHDWLYGAPPSLSTVARNGVPRIRGVEVNLTPQEVLEVARQALSRDEKYAANFHKWYVQVDDRRVAPKWLVSQLTGLPVGDFVTDDARRLLTQLGVEVMRA